MFGSPSIKIHLLRGVAGFAFLAIFLSYSSELGWWALVPAAGALVSFGGCPTCWLVGLGGSILNGEPISLCLDGSCARSESTGGTETTTQDATHFFFRPTQGSGEADAWTGGVLWTDSSLGAAEPKQAGQGAGRGPGVRPTVCEPKEN